MISSGTLESVPIDKIVLDKTNPRIRKFLEMYGDSPTPEQIYLALGAGGEDDSTGNSTTFEKLKNSIMTNGGVIQPVILNRRPDGTLVCVEGNTRVALYNGFQTDGVKGKWTEIPALVHDNIGEDEIDAIRLQVHLVGPRPWDPYSKGKYLHFLRMREHLPFATIVDYCGGRLKEVTESINAFTDMEAYYRPIIPEDGAFDPSRFSGFVELQKPGIKEAIVQTGFTLKDFAQWIYEEKLYPLNTVRILPRILRNPKAREVFLKQGARKAESFLEKPELNKVLLDADLGQLARALTQKIEALRFDELQRLKADVGGATVQSLIDAKEALDGLSAELEIIE